MATVGEQRSATTEAQHGYELVGEGENVVEHEPVEGRSLWLDSPEAVIAFVTGGDVAETIVISRGGATTFMAPALTAGVGGLITLQGGRESHLGIVSREFGIPCVMSVGFTRGITTDQGETIPADGTLLRLDTSTMPRASVYMGRK